MIVRWGDLELAACGFGTPFAPAALVSTKNTTWVGPVSSGYSNTHTEHREARQLQNSLLEAGLRAIGPASNTDGGNTPGCHGSARRLREDVPSVHDRPTCLAHIYSRHVAIEAHSIAHPAERHWGFATSDRLPSTIAHRRC